MDLSETIKQYYFDNFNQLPLDKKFHFASRIADWQNDDKAYAILSDLKVSFVPTSDEAAQKMFLELVNKKQEGTRNAHSLRQPYFEKYPQLWGLHLALFRTRHLLTIYGLDCREQLYQAASKERLDTLADTLLANEEAVRILSTFAVNYLYLYRQILQDDPEAIDPNYFIGVSEGYNLANKNHLQLLIYLFTHCIIGETNFYTKPVPASRLGSYTEMLVRLDSLIKENYPLINLDNKLEFLVCGRICDYQSDLSVQINMECQHSLSKEGHFLVDTHNNNAQEDRASFEKSEHRNVLYIMSQSLYTPHSPRSLG